MRINDRIMALGTEHDQTRLSKPRSADLIQAELVPCGEAFVKAPDGASRKALAAWIEALRDELVRAKAVEGRDRSP